MIKLDRRTPLSCRKIINFHLGLLSFSSWYPPLLPLRYSNISLLSLFFFPIPNSNLFIDFPPSRSIIPHDRGFFSFFAIPPPILLPLSSPLPSQVL